jgi:2-polyprenyl-6-hydroxyphenyl methylase/3-demethylubiquinone-9 3-methyltransferase
MDSEAARVRPSGTVDAAEIDRFERLAASWWDPEGPSKPLHRLNPARIGFIRDRLIAHFARDAMAIRPFGGLSLLDVGCGGGLVTEPMARMGFDVTGIDAAAGHLPVATAHAAAEGLAIEYRCCSAEDLVAGGASYDCVLALEIVEHVSNPPAFLGALGRLVRPGGAVILSTLNRTPKSFALGIVAAEYILGWVPRGTHRWRKFLKPSELAAAARAAGLRPTELAGLLYDPATGGWSIGRDLGMNYLMLAVKPAA